MRDFYEILGIAPDASNDEVRLAYRSKVKEAHPDAGGSNEAFSEVVLAYEVLMDEDRRRQYDETGDAGDTGKEILQGAKLIVEQLLNDLIQRDDAKYHDLIPVMCSNISRVIGEKHANIDSLERHRNRLADLKKRFRPRSPTETSLHDLFETKLETVSKAIASERLSIAHLNAASSLLRRYDFVRERDSAASRSGGIDPTAFGRPFDPLLDTSEFSTKAKNG